MLPISLTRYILKYNFYPEVLLIQLFCYVKVLKRQVQSLTMHQKKLEAELMQIEEKYTQKKRKFLESSDDFGAELKKHCVHAVDDAKYKEMVTEQVNNGVKYP